jgi:HEPN domain-containing protein
MKLSVDITPEFQSFVDGLIQEIHPAAVLCFGASTTSVMHTSCYQSRASQHNHYDLLIVRTITCRWQDHEIVDMVKSRNKQLISVSVLCHGEASVTRAIKERHPFFCTVFCEGAILYKADHFQFPIHEVANLYFDSIQQQRVYKRALELSVSFLSMASEAISGGTHDVGVFLLHQSVEQMCIASIKAHMKYRASTHSIGRLIDLVACYIPSARDLFPCNTPDERELYSFLTKAYSDVRYKATYYIPAHIALSLLRRVEKLREMIEEKFQYEFGSEVAKG